MSNISTTVNVDSLSLTEQVAYYKAEREKLLAQASLQQKRQTLKVGEKGNVCVYGMGRFPISLYSEQWVTLLGMADEIRAFIEAHKDELVNKGEVRDPVTGMIHSVETTDGQRALENQKARREQTKLAFEAKEAERAARKATPGMNIVRRSATSVTSA
jgi:hypothetical protein